MMRVILSILLIALTVGHADAWISYGYLRAQGIHLKNQADSYQINLKPATASSETTITVPNAAGTMAVSASSPLSLSSAGAMSIPNAAADGSTKGAAAFNATNFSASAGVVNTIQGISTAATPQFTRMGIGVAAAATDPLQVKGPISSGSSSLDLNNGDTYTGSNSTTQIRFGYNNSTNYAQWIATRHNGGSAANNAIDFYTDDGTSGPVFPTNAILGMSIENGKVGFAKESPSYAIDAAGAAKLLKTTTQLMLYYDASNHADFTVGSTGNLTVAPSGGTYILTGAFESSGVAQIGSATPVAYSRIGSSSASHASGANDLFVTGVAEVASGAYVGSLSATGAVVAGTTVSAKQFYSSGTPSVTVQAGAGTGATATLATNSNDGAGIITLVGGSSATAYSKQVVFTCGNSPTHACVGIISAESSVPFPGIASGGFFTVPTATGFEIWSDGTAVTNTTTYAINYITRSY